MVGAGDGAGIGAGARGVKAVRRSQQLCAAAMPTAFPRFARQSAHSL
jgi:hypothetical protein